MSMFFLLTNVPKRLMSELANVLPKPLIIDTHSSSLLFAPLTNVSAHCAKHILDVLTTRSPLSSTQSKLGDKYC